MFGKKRLLGLLLGLGFVVSMLVTASVFARQFELSGFDRFTFAEDGIGIFQIYGIQRCICLVVNLIQLHQQVHLHPVIRKNLEKEQLNIRFILDTGR
ncbi:MAG TPA: hypothetical protein PLZ08_01695 [Bacillota bacterium]|nr:hypothetical protein [Bacillota bacterium]HOL08644.1 hypothetical protein [Bacillota bacterium]HPO96654.1 hypothetical protein [Bacillota bacterium]